MSDTPSGQTPLPPGAIAALFARQRPAGHEIQNIPTVVVIDEGVPPHQLAQLMGAAASANRARGHRLLDVVGVSGSGSMAISQLARTQIMGGFLMPGDVATWQNAFNVSIDGGNSTPPRGGRPERAADATPQPAYKGKLTGPVRTLLSIFDRWMIDDRDAALFLGSNSPEFMKDLRVGTAGLNSRDTKDRARYLIEIYEGVQGLLRDPAAERSWIGVPLQGLEGQSILGIMKRGSITDLLYVKSFIDHANGR